VELFGLRVFYHTPSAVWLFVKLSYIQLFCRYHIQVTLNMFYLWYLSDRSRQQSGGEPSFTQEVPEKYFVVSNDNYVRVKYVLIFDKLGYTQERQSWLMRHKFVLVIMLYLILLLIISLLQSRIIRQFFSNRYIIG
jgi:hypothetical protein